MSPLDSSSGRWALRDLLAPTGPARFFEDTWAREAALYPRSIDPGSILSLASFETLLATLNRANDGWLHFARGGLKAVPPEMVDAQGMLDLRKVRAAFASGETLYLTKAERVCEPLMRIARAVELDLAAHGVQVREPVNAHVFLTPPHSQGFPAHRDEHASFVLQLDGCKEWAVYEPGERGALSPGRVEARSLEGTKKNSFHLKPGDVLYMPEWWPHEATAVNAHSLHVTLRMFPLRWVDVLLEVCRDHPALAHAVPLEFARTAESMKVPLLELLASDEFRRDLPEMLEVFARKHGVPKAVLPDNGFRQLLEADGIGPETRLVRSAGAACEVFDAGQDVCLAFPGGVIRGPAAIKPVFCFVADAFELHPRDLPSLGEVEYDRLDVARKLVKDGLLRIGDARL